MQTLAYKYRLYPNKVQTAVFKQYFGCTRLLYNQLLAWWKNEYALAKGQNRKMSNLPLVTYFKQQFPFLNGIDSLALMNTRRHIETAFKACFKHKTARFPVFKKRGKCRDTYTTSCVNGNITIGDNTIKLPKIGRVKCKYHRPMPDGAKLLTATVSRERNGKWYVSVTFECDNNIPEHNTPDSPKVVGLDMSLSQFVVSSDKDDDVAKTKYVRQYRESEKTLARLSRRLSKKQAGSRNREKTRIRLARHAQRVANRRRDFVIKQALHYATNYDVVVVEDLDMKSMSRSLNLGKSVMDLGWGEFRRWLDWQGMKHNCEIVVVDKFYPSSKTCNHCGYVNKSLTLSDREWVCPECGKVIDRDYNAACNLRDWYFMKYNTLGTIEINASGESCQYSGKGTLSEQTVSVKEEATELIRW